MSNGGTLGITSEEPGAIAQEAEEEEETPQQLAEWTPNDVF